MLRSYFKNAGILGLTEILLRLKGLILMPVLTKHFGAVNYGIWAQVSILVSMFSPLLVIGTGSALVRFLPGVTQKEKRQGLSTVLVYILFVSLVVIIFLWILDEAFATAFFESAENARYVSLCGFVIATGLILDVFRNWYRIEDQAKIYAAINILQSVVGAGLAIGVVIMDFGIFELIVFITSFEAVLCFVLLLHVLKTYGLSRPCLSLLKRYMRYGLPLMPAGYAMWALNASDRLFIVHYGNLNDVGVYSVLYNLGYLFISMFFAPIWTMYPARASELYNVGDLEGLNRLFRYSTRAALALLVPVMAGFSALAVPIMQILTTAEFVRGAYLVPIVTLSYVFHLMGSYWAVSLGLVNRPGLCTVNIFIAAASHLFLNVLLIPRWGIAGAALATVMGFALQMGLDIWRGSSYLHLKFDWLFLYKVVLASGMMSLAIVQFHPKSLWTILLSISAGVLIYVFGLLFFRAISTEEKQVMLRLVRLQWITRFRIVRLVTGISIL